MPRDQLQRRDALVTNLTIMQLQVALLHRQLTRRASLREADRQWLETSLAAIAQTLRVITPLLVEDGTLEREQWVRGIPTQPLTTFELPSRRN